MGTLRVGMVGLGVVGGGVAKILQESAAELARRSGRRLELTRVAVRDPAKSRDIALPAGIVTDDLAKVVEGDACDVVIELMGGTTTARDVVLRALANGKSVVTANKALLATHGAELFAAARQAGQTIAFEAAVAGGVPIIANLSQCLTANRIESLTAILNGTCNFILSKMHAEGVPYSDVIAEAQRLGYAEADPAMDVDGTDTVQKLTILAQLAFGAVADWATVPRGGIDTLDLADVRFAQQRGYTIKLLGVAQSTPTGVQLRVGPTLVKNERQLAQVGGAFNAVRVTADAVGELLYYGPGAGRMPTASAVVADLVDTAVGRARLTFDTLGLWDASAPGPAIASPADAIGRYYLRVIGDDQPGVLAQIAGCLAAQGISIASFLQHEPLTDGKLVPLIITTHDTTEGAAARACDKIAALESVQGKPVRLRIAD
ncbi:homoserine dehydrogenase [Botrimarina hoheduenensis]|uniref:Homoserine dehydrogenase n=1 Tax=Botrimarina hoheduenensis TaxID=2528000 RepID=A0A5C5WBV2_9BACT|nr:homoserine dehydrogenase [Botrimarina hoheduenensis]TWT47575.1 Homoserine dehydrogenase [Botrimarina hoheduenensis]